MTTEKPKRGRPPTGKTPVMQIGRVPPAEQAELRAAAERSGKTLTAWATEILLRAARRK